MAEDRRRVAIGTLGAAAGLNGEIKVTLYAADSENLHRGTVLYINAENSENSPGKSLEATACEVTALRYQKGRPIVRLAGVENRTAAERLTGREIAIAEDALAPLPEGRYYYRDLLGMTVYDRASRTELGQLTDIRDETAQELLVVTRPNGSELLIPQVGAFVKEVSLERRTIEVELIPGFL